MNVFGKFVVVVLLVVGLVCIALTVVVLRVVAVVLIGRGRIVVVGIVLSFSVLNTLILSLLKSFFSNGFVMISI